MNRCSHHLSCAFLLTLRADHLSVLRRESRRLFLYHGTASAQSLIRSGSASFYIWTSVYNLFITSVFWCPMADIFRSEQASALRLHRCGRYLGAIAGSYVTATLAERLGTVNLLLVSVVPSETASLAATPPPFRRTRHRRWRRLGRTTNRRNHGAGITSPMRSPYLLGISSFKFSIRSVDST